MALKRKWVRWAILGAVAALLIALVVLLEPWGWQKLDLDRLTQLNQTSIVYDASGERAGSLYGSENRVYVTLDKIPLHVQQAFIAAEDQRFYEHPGVDVVRMFGALWHDIRTMSLEQGASTITQQLIKLTIYAAKRHSPARRRRRCWLLQLERQMDKDDILERYLNVVYFGRGAYGVEAAANAYAASTSGTDAGGRGASGGRHQIAKQLRAASGAGNAVERRDLILQEMVDCGFITGTEAGKRAKRGARPRPFRGERAIRMVSDAAATEAQSILDISRDELLAGGYAIYTALDPQAQAAAEELFANGANFPVPAPTARPRRRRWCGKC